MVSISNELSKFSPIPETVLETEAQAAFHGSNTNVSQGIEDFLKRLSEKTEDKTYKFVVSVTSIDKAAHGPLKTYTGAYWNADQDGSWATYLESLKLLITLTWIRI